MFLATNPTLLEMGCISLGASQGQEDFSSQGNIVARFEKFIEASADPIDQI